MKKICTLISFLFSVNLMMAQVNAFVGVGIATYAMSDMKELQKEYASQFPVVPKITSSFPAYWMYEIGATIKLDSTISIGGSIGYYSTGGRIAYSDYSGELRLDQIATSFSIGVPVQFQLNKNKKNILAFEMMPVVFLGSYDMKVMSRLGTQESNDSESFIETNIGIQPSVVFNRKIKQFGFFARAGYLVQVYNSKLYLKQDHNAYLLNSEGQEVHLNWSGLRTSVGMSFTF
jgi:hypothetical protein